MILLVTGGRTFCESTDIAGKPLDKHRDRVMDERRALALALDMLSPTAIVNGAQRGADRWSSIYAAKRSVDLIEVPAEWETYGPSAGPRRNQLMLERYVPDAAVVCEGGVGTADMRRRLIAAGVPIYEISLRVRPSPIQPAARPERQPSFAGR